MVGGRGAAVAGDSLPSNSESDEDSIVENSWQKHPLKGFAGDSLPEKLGEILAVLYDW